MTALEVDDFRIHKGLLDPDAQRALLGEIRAVAVAAPLFSPETPRGGRMSVRMTSAGRFGWFSDRRGYRYVDRHPSGASWPPLPPAVRALWRRLISGARDPDCCLINFYGAETRMGLHRDADEADFSWPVLSVSLGDPARFRMGGPDRSDPTRSIWLESGDVVVMGGRARLAYHGVDRIRFGVSPLLPDGGRVNLTCRVVT